MYPKNFAFPKHPGLLKHLPHLSMRTRHVPVEADTPELGLEFIAEFCPGRTEQPVVEITDPLSVVLGAKIESDAASDTDFHDSFILIHDQLQEDNGRGPSETRLFVFRELVTAPPGPNITPLSFQPPLPSAPSSAIPLAQVILMPALASASKLRQHADRVNQNKLKKEQEASETATPSSSGITSSGTMGDVPEEVQWVETMMGVMIMTTIEDPPSLSRQI